MENLEKRKLYNGQKKSLYQISREAHIPIAMLYDTVSQKRKLKNTRLETVLKISRLEGITVEELVEKAKEIGIE